MINQYTLDLNREIFVDGFAGGGGASRGVYMALNRHVDHAFNHAWDALGMHRINHPQTVHHCEDIFDVDPWEVAEGRPVGGGWFSPDCKHFSKAKGGKPLSKKIRGLAFSILRWAKIQTRVIYMENVEEIQTWGPLLRNNKPDPRYKGRTFKAFKDVLGRGVPADHPDIPEILEVLASDNPHMNITKADLVRGFGYHVEIKEIRAFVYGSRTIRKRLYMIARCDGQPIVWPDPTHGDPRLAETKAKNLKPWGIIADCIEWGIPCKSIFLTPAQAKVQRCRRPLAKSTLKRIATGVDRYVLKAKRPFLVSLTHQGGERVESVDEPGMTVTGAHRGEKALVDFTKTKQFREQMREVADENIANFDFTKAPFVSEHANASNQRNMPADEPGRTQCAEVKGGHFSLVAAHMVQKGHLKSNSKMVKGADEPMRTQVSRSEHGVVAASLCREFGESVGQPVAEPAPTVMPGGQGKTSLIAASLTKFTTGSVGQPADEPIATIPAGSHSEETHGGAATVHGLITADIVKLRGTNTGSGVDEPMHTASAGGTHHGLVTGTLVGAGGRAAQSRPRGMDEPSHTTTAKADTCLAAVYLAQHNGGFNENPGHPADEPSSTISATGSQQQVVAGTLAAYYGNDQDGQGVDAPARTVTTKERFGFVESKAFTPLMTDEQINGARVVAQFLRDHGVVFEGEFATVTGYVIVDIGMRMLTPRELFRAQGFPDDYIIDRAWVIDPKNGDIKEITLTKEQQIRMCGNSVCPDVAAALVKANSGDMTVPEKAARPRMARGGLKRREGVMA